MVAVLVIPKKFSPLIALRLMTKAGKQLGFFPYRNQTLLELKQ